MDHRSEYVARINRVIDHIETHLDEELTLERLAKVACFSPYHFHRIFGSMVGETLQRFIQRLRLERAATQLDLDPERSITEVALDNGFASSATFARAFRQTFGMSASAWRKLGKEERKLSKTLSKPSKEGRRGLAYVDFEKRRSDMTQLELNVSVNELNPVRVAYVRHIGPYQGDSALFGQLFGKLATWAGPRGLLGAAPDFRAVYHDNPEITDPDKLRLSICLPVDDDVEVGGEVGAMEIPGGTYAVAKFRIDADQYPAAWQALMARWFPDSGYQPDDRICFERYLNNPETDPEGKHEVEICMPVKPL